MVDSFACFLFVLSVMYFDYFWIAYLKKLYYEEGLMLVYTFNS